MKIILQLIGWALFGVGLYVYTWAEREQDEKEKKEKKKVAGIVFGLGFLLHGIAEFSFADD